MADPGAIGAGPNLGPLGRGAVGNSRLQDPRRGVGRWSRHLEALARTDRWVHRSHRRQLHEVEQPRAFRWLGLRSNLRQPRWWWWCWRWWWCARQLHATSRSALQRTDHPAVRPGVECRHASDGRSGLHAQLAQPGALGCGGESGRRRTFQSAEQPTVWWRVVVVVRLAVVAVATRCRGWPVAARLGLMVLLR